MIKRTNMEKKVIIEIICFLFIFLFIYASLSKILKYEDFAFTMMQSPLLNGYERILMWLVPSLELLVVPLLLIPKYRQVGLHASFSLMITFSVYIIAIQFVGDEIPCSCGGILGRMSWTAHLIFNIGFASLGAVGILLNTSTSFHNTHTTA